jgi:hypothetical protein
VEWQAMRSALDVEEGDVVHECLAATAPCSFIAPSSSC